MYRGFEKINAPLVQLICVFVGSFDLVILPSAGVLGSLIPRPFAGVPGKF